MTRASLTLGIALAMTAAACGSDSPTAPTPSQTRLADGAYTLVVDTNVSADAERACAQVGLAATRVALPVTVGAAGSGWTVRPDGAADLGLRLALTTSTAGLGGTLGGDAFDPAAGVTLSVASAAAPAPVLGTIASTRAASGSVAGTVRLTADGRTRQCGVASWRLDAR